MNSMMSFCNGEITMSSREIAAHQSRFTPAGVAWIAKRFGLMGAA